MSILSIQSAVAYGHVGNAAAVFPLRGLGHDVWPVDTVSFSNHPRYGEWRGRVHPPAEVEAILRGVEARGAFANCRSVLSGFLGDPGTGPVVLSALRRVKAASPDAVYWLDPVMGDAETGVYVAEGIPEFFRHQAVAAADIVIPNGYELALLTERPVTSDAEARAAAEDLLGRGVKIVVVTGLAHDGEIATIAVTGDGAWRVATPLVAAPAHGAGDVFAALFLGNYLSFRRVPVALGRAVSSLHGIFEATRRLGTDALAIVAAQDEIVAPTRSFRARSL